MAVEKRTADSEVQNKKPALTIAGFAHLIHDGFTDALLVLLPIWAKSFGLGYTEIGALKMVMSTCLAAFQVPVGILSEKVGERMFLALGTIIVGFGFILFWFVSSYTGLIICLAVVGLGASTQHPLGSAIVSRAFSDHERRSAMGVYNFSGDLGKVIFPLSVAAVTAAYGWRIGSISLGMFGIAAGITIYFVLRSLNVGHLQEKPVRLDRNTFGKTGWGINDVAGYTCLSAIGMVDTSVRLSFLTFLPFLLIEKGAEVTVIGFALTLVFSGGAAGKLVCGLISDRVGILRTIFLTEILTATGILVLVAVPLEIAMILLPFIGLVLNGTSSVLYGTVGDFVDPARQARAFGLFYTLGVGAGAITPFFYGFLTDQWGLQLCFYALVVSLLVVLPFCIPLVPRLVSKT